MHSSLAASYPADTLTFPRVGPLAISFCNTFAWVAGGRTRVIFSGFSVENLDQKSVTAVWDEVDGALLLAVIVPLEWVGDSAILG